jgi:hypothetical protein
MANEGGDNKTLAYIAIVVAVALCGIAAFALGIGSNSGDPQSQQLNSIPADASDPKIQSLIQAINIKIDGCKAAQENRKFLEDMATSLTDEGAYAKAIDSAAKTSTDAQAHKDKIHSLITSASASLQQLITMANDCASKRDPNADNQVSQIWGDIKQKVDSLRSELAIALKGLYYFPGVEQGQHRYCQQAAAAMVALTYISDYGTTPVTQLDSSSLPAYFLTAVETGKTPAVLPKTWSRYNNDPGLVAGAIANKAPIAWFTTPINPTKCVIGVMDTAPIFLNKVGAPVPNDWVFVSGAKTDSGRAPDLLIGGSNESEMRTKVLAAIKHSVTQVPPDPVILDATNLSACSYAHNFPLFQYVNGKFVSNNPQPGGILYNQTRCGSKELNDANVSQFARLVIRKVHLQAVGLMP